MMKGSHEEALRAMIEAFEDRFRRRLLVRESEPNAEGPLSFVLPTSVGEVELLSEVAQRYSVTLVAQGARTAYEPGSEKGVLLVRFDLMRRTRLPANFEEPWAEAEAGTLWLELDDELHARARGLTVYPTSAPRTTIGGWMAMDGLGVGSFEYGWLRENVLSADVVLPGGERRKVRGEELHSFVGPSSGSAGIVVGATLRTRRVDADVPFSATFTNAEDLVRAVMGVLEAGVPLWHLGFLDPQMAYARSLGEEHLLFGAYPWERGVAVEEDLRNIIESCRGAGLSAAETYRVWGQRFFPVAPSHPIPSASREFVSVADLLEALGGAVSRPEHIALQGTVARTGEVLLLSVDTRGLGWTRA
jgi:FAD/FMN-containing dehydrogenase